MPLLILMWVDSPVFHGKNQIKIKELLAEPVELHLRDTGAGEHDLVGWFEG